jgi:tetratricopeptide (TPR) repeat protein
VIVSSLFELLMLWLLLAVAVGMVVLAVRARRLELAEGLASSRKRLIAVGVVGAAAAALVLGATAQSVFPPRAAEPVDRPPPAEPADPLVAAQRKELEKRKAELYAEIDRLNAEIARLAPAEEAPAVAEASRPWYDFDVGPLAHFLVPILVMLGTVALVTLGDPTTLLRRGWLGASGEDDEEADRARTGLDRLAQLADLGQFRDGLQAAAAVEVGRLEKLDRLDWIFLKSYCAVQVVATEKAEDGGHRELLETAVRDLDTLLEQAPNRGEAVYLLAMAHGLLGARAEALGAFEKAATLLPGRASKLPFAHNESVCLLGLAEEALGRGDAEGASRHFDQVTRRGVLVDRIPTSLVKVRLLNVRRSLVEAKDEEAARGIEAVRKVEGLDAEQRRGIEGICDALETLIAVRQGDPPAILRHTETFLARHLPPGLPEPDEEIVEEYLESPAAGLELRLAPAIFRAFLFLQAEARGRIAAKSGVPPTDAQVQAITRPLFRALQFELRQRDILATLGGLYYWFVPDGRKKALQWLEAAAAMGVEGRIARRLLEEGRARELEHREAMEWFRSTSVRFLHDPTVAAQVRRALIEELGRFQEFQPILLDLESSPELEPREPTLRLLRERAGYLEKMVADLATRKAGAVGPQLHELRQDYQQLIAALDASTGRMAEIERRLMQEVGKVVIS